MILKKRLASQSKECRREGGFYLFLSTILTLPEDEVPLSYIKLKT